MDRGESEVESEDVVVLEAIPDLEALRADPHETLLGVEALCASVLLIHAEPHPGRAAGDCLLGGGSEEPRCDAGAMGATKP